MRFKSTSFLILASFAFFLSGCKSESPQKIFTSVDDIPNSKVAVTTGTTHDKWMRDNAPNAEVNRFDTQTDLLLALKGKKVEMIIIDGMAFKMEYSSDKTLGVLVEKLFEEEYGVGFNKKDNELRGQFNTFLKKIRADGTYDEICKRWVDSLSTAQMPDFSDIPRSGEPLKVACSGDTPVFDYVKDGRVVGLDIEIMERFAAELGRPIEIQIINFGGLIPALASGVVDIISASICITPERSKMVAFSDPYFAGYASVVALSENLPKGFSSMKDVGNKTIAVLLGSAQEEFARKAYPEATLMRIGNNSDVLLALKSGQCDVAILSHLEVKTFLENNSDYTILEDGLNKDPIAMCFRKGDAVLTRQFNKFLNDLKESGELQEICLRWYNNELNNAAMPQFDILKNGQPLIIATSLLSPPFTFAGSNGPQGLDIELAIRFAISIGRKPEFKTMNFDSLIPCLVSGKADMVANAVMITKERANMIDFSDPYMDITATAIVKKSQFAAPQKEYSVIADGDGSDLDQSAVAVMTGSYSELLMREHYPDAKLSLFDELPDAITALATKKVRYVMTSYTNAVVACRQNKDMVLLKNHYSEEGAGIAVAKGNKKLLDGINSAIAELKSDGTLKDMINRWIETSTGEYLDMDVPKVNKGEVLKVAISANREPMCFVHNGEFAGLDVELMKRVAFKLGMKIEFQDMKFAALTAALTSGKVDAVASNFTETEERKKTVDFSDTYFTNPQILIVTATVINGSGKENKNFFKRIADSFYNNLIHENRYMLILNGLWRTIIISIFSLLLGTVLGACICWMKMGKNKVLKGFAKGYIDIMRGTPLLVMLMIVFYVVFAKSDISATTVAIFTFAMNFAAYVSEMFRTSIEGIDRGQKEAGVALGFTNIQTFCFIIVPQAVKRVLPVYKGESISLIKMTSIVGYIAVQDLTKASDIIRSRTFDAFFPLIVITIIYFLLAWIFGLLLDLLNKN